MSVPTEFDWILVKVGDGATPTEAFTLICGVQDVSVNATVATSDRAARDCSKPGEIPYRKTRATSKQLDVSGSGLTNAGGVSLLEEVLGVVRNYRIEGYAEDGTDAGTLLGTYSGPFRMTASNMSSTRDGDSAAEITLASHGAWTWTPAP